MTYYEVRMKHTETTLTALAHMQYDMFCRKQQFIRTLISVAVLVLGVVNVTQWWGLVLIAYGSFLMTGKYTAANRTASKIAKQLQSTEGEYPSSLYLFEESSLRVITLPGNDELDPLPYSDVAGLGEDGTAFYVFRNPYGGYMIPRSELGEHTEEFRSFLEKKTGKTFYGKRSRFTGFHLWEGRSSEPPHL